MSAAVLQAEASASAPNPVSVCVVALQDAAQVLDCAVCRLAPRLHASVAASLSASESLMLEMSDAAREAVFLARGTATALGKGLDACVEAQRVTGQQLDRTAAWIDALLQSECDEDEVTAALDLATRLLLHDAPCPAWFVTAVLAEPLPSSFCSLLSDVDVGSVVVGGAGLLRYDAGGDNVIRIALSEGAVTRGARLVTEDVCVCVDEQDVGDVSAVGAGEVEAQYSQAVAEADTRTSVCVGVWVFGYPAPHSPWTVHVSFIQMCCLLSASQARV